MSGLEPLPTLSGIPFQWPPKKGWAEKTELLSPIRNAFSHALKPGNRV